MRSIKGMSLITIMVIVAILAVIAAFAIPAWRTQAIRNHVTDALKATDAAKLVVMEAATTQGGLAHLKGGDLHYSPAAVSNEYVAKLEISDGGRIALTTRNTGVSPDPVLVLIPSESGTDNKSPIDWSCTMTVGPQAATPQSCSGTGLPSASPATVPTPEHPPIANGS